MASLAVYDDPFFRAASEKPEMILLPIKKMYKTDLSFVLLTRFRVRHEFNPTIPIREKEVPMKDANEAVTRIALIPIEWDLSLSNPGPAPHIAEYRNPRKSLQI